MRIVEWELMERLEIRWKVKLGFLGVNVIVKKQREKIL